MKLLHSATVSGQPGATFHLFITLLCHSASLLPQVRQKSDLRHSSMLLHLLKESLILFLIISRKNKLKQHLNVVWISISPAEHLCELCCQIRDRLWAISILTHSALLPSHYHRQHLLSGLSAPTDGFFFSFFMTFVNIALLNLMFSFH